MLDHETTALLESGSFVAAMTKARQTVGTVQLLLSAATLLLVFTPPVRAQQAMTMTFSFAEPVVQVNGPAYLEVKMQNTGSEKLRVSFGYHGKWNYDFFVVEPDGTKVAVPPYRQYGPGPSGNVSIDPQGTETRRLLLNEWYVFRKPGEYTVNVKVAALLRTSTSTSWQSEFSDKLTLQVAPRDPARLKEICENLAAAAVATSPPDSNTATESAFALSYIPDPVAVPYLARVLREGNSAGREHAIRGLARVGSPDAIEVLKANRHNADPEIRSQVEAALAQIRSGT